MSRRAPQPPRGMRDILPAEMRVRDALMATIVATFHRYGFSRIETPALEMIETLTGDDGGENAKLVFQVMKRGDKLQEALAEVAEDGSADIADLGLRFDLTVPLCRFVAANRAKLPAILKTIQIAPVWRAERPQKGRLRQFYQCDIDTLGLAPPLAEIELLSASAEALKALGFKNFRIRVNDRRLLTAIAHQAQIPEAQHGAVFIALDKLDKIGPDGVAKALAESGIEEQAIARLMTLTGIGGEMADDPLEALAQSFAAAGAAADEQVFTDLRTLLDHINIAGNGDFHAMFDLTLVRGMGYYTGPIFEFDYKDYPFSIAGGGRYDNLVGKLSGQDMPACGISLGFERLVTILEEEREFAAGTGDGVLALLYDKNTPARAVSETAARLRGAEGAVSLYPRAKRMGKQLGGLAELGCDRYVTMEADGSLGDIRVLSGT